MSDASTPGTVGHDWARFDAMSADERHGAAMEDRDSQPLAPEDLSRMRRTPSVRIIRRALGWSEEQFARVFRIPEPMLRDWENGRAKPNEAIEAYLQVIAALPDVVAQTLGTIEDQREDQRYPTGPGSEYDSLRRYGDGFSGR